ncbi:hypothetical protein [Corallococcus sp. AB032C]|uniref:hypothetical protein n=1 Tax=Corallococcus sp. AB032C TaxID=2316717 RepID=UPI0018F7CD08|nr:hypothetical protein [Corallococcus sp. AB032C]
MPHWLRMALFLVPVTTLLALAHVYLYRRLVRDVTASRGLSLIHTSQPPRDS